MPHARQIRNLWVLAFALSVFGLFIFSFQNCSPVGFTGTNQEETQLPSKIPDSLIRGTLTNAVTNAKLKDVTVKIRLASHPNQVLLKLKTDANGIYRTGALLPGRYLVDFSLNGFIDILNVPAEVVEGQETVLNKSMSTSLEDGQIRIVLNWCDAKPGAVEDVDSYLIVPQTNTPIYFNNKVGYGAHLDIDVRKWKGPETTTITQIHQGTYVFYVNNFTDRYDKQALGRSDVSVTVYKGNQVLKQYQIPQGRGTTFEVFRIVNGQLVDVLKYNDDLLVATY